MLSLCKSAIAGGVLILSTMAAHASVTSTPEGLWKTIDDASGQPKSIVQISESDNHVLSGKVVKLFKDPDKVCSACDGDNHNKPIVGLAVMNQLVPDKKKDGQWVSGQILDPKNGKTYHCNVKLVDGGRKLQVRGYIGLPVFGRSQTWERVAG